MGDLEDQADKKRNEEESVPPVSSRDLYGEPSHDSFDVLKKQVGPYKLLSVLGEGGWGIVYLAEQKEPVSRRVALKIIKPGMDSKQVIARFETERQAMVLLDHHNIAKVYSAGTTENGRPYFAMEYIKGLPITKHCDQNKLNIDDRLKLFLQVCSAIQHAHQKGIIHRDIKPSNILVSTEDDKDIPKIIDFGVAKALNQPLTERTLFTEQGQLIGTPEYMSPEQIDINAQETDVCSDIYSLGVLLYELLTGALPFDRETFRKAAFNEIQRIIREKDPPKPSTRLSNLGEKAKEIAEKRRIELSLLAKRLSKELEWIPLKAIRKEPKERYRSAAELADDVENYLNGRPLVAGPESKIYRARKFVKRNRILVTATAIVLISLVLGAVTSTILAIGQTRARKEAEKQMKISQAINNFLNNDLLASFDPFKAKGGEITVMEILDTATEKLKGKFSNAPSIEASICEMLGTAYMNLGNYEASELLLKRAIELRRSEFGEKHPDTLSSMAALYTLYGNQGHFKEAEELCAKTLETRRIVLGEEHPETLKSMAHLGWLYSSHGHYIEAEPLLAKALELQRRVLGEEHPDTLWSMHNLALPHTYLDRYNEAESLLSKVLEISRRVHGEQHSETIWIMYQLGDMYSRQGRLNDAEPLYVKALKISQNVFGDEYKTTLYGMRILGECYSNQGRYKEAEPLLVKALEIQRRVLGEESADTLLSMRNLGELYIKQSRYKEAEQLLIEVMEISLRVFGEEDPQTLWPVSSLGRLYNNQHRYNEAEPLFIKALEISRRLYGNRHLQTLWSISNLGWLYDNQGRYKEAEPLFVEMLEIHRQLYGDEHQLTLEQMYNLGQLYINQGLYREAEQVLRQTEELFEKLVVNFPDVPDYQNDLAANNIQLAYVLRETGRPDEAEQSYQKGLLVYGKAIEINPNNPGSWSGRGNIYLNMGKWDKVITDYSKAIELKPGDWWYWHERGFAYIQLKQWDKVVTDYTKAISLNPDDCSNYERRAQAYQALGKFDKAISDCTKVVLLNEEMTADSPNLPAYQDDLANSYIRLGNVLWKAGHLDEAGRAYQKGLEIRDVLGTKDPAVLNGLAWLQATSPMAELRNGAKAIEHATEACELTEWKSASYIDTLAAAYAEAGDFDSAVKWQKNAIELLTSKEPNDWLTGFKSRLELYKSGKPYRVNKP
jgi:serine/threonine protein kinase/Flp pilus assembly protein TadD